MNGLKKEVGLTLVELMVALVLGSILLIGIMQLMITSTGLGMRSDFVSRNQATANTILDLIGTNVRLAGYNGCAEGGVLTLMTNPTSSNSGLNPVYPLIPTKGSNGFSGNAKNNIGLVVRFGIDENLLANTQFENSAWEGFLAKLSAKDCLNRTLYWREFRVSNCDANNICFAWNNVMGTTSLETEHEIENARLDKMVFNVVTALGKYKQITIGGDSSTYTPAEVYQKYENVGTNPTNEMDELLKTVSVTIYVTVTTKDPEVKGATGSNDFEKSYSATYVVRNLQ